MALGSTVRTFEIELSDMDRGIYETLSLKVAQHPSETNDYLVARVIAYALEFREGLEFSSGLSSNNEPALWVRDLTGQLQAWIEIGTPDAARLHKASKAAEAVAVYCHKEPGAWFRGLANAKVHRSEHIALHLLDRATIRDLAEQLERRNAWSLSRMEGTIYLETGAGTHELNADVTPWPA